MRSEINKVKAGPTKEFFVSMITRDILLPDAIVELIDNSIDGIKRQKVSKYNDYYIHVNFDQESFKIEDNCGGIDLAIATDYAFVFGKPQEARDKEERVETTGTFGIGMKRALFKMGQEFEVSSKSKNSEFVLKVNVADWMKEDEWDFPLVSSDDTVNYDEKECGTTIIVTKLFSGISQSFHYNAFINEIINTVRRKTNSEIKNGLTITINGSKIEGSFLSIAMGGNVMPYKYTFDSNNITVMILAGISTETNPDKAGWYVYCNNREILSADKTSLTTWKDDSDNEGIKYHNDYATFRGFVFFTSKYPEMLPWNTSKTGIDSSSMIYKETRPHMIDAFKVITAELKKLAKLDEEIRTAITQDLKKQTPKEIHYYAATEISNRTNISFIDPYIRQFENEASKIPMTTISYKAELELVDKVKKALDVSKIIKMLA
ncbi:ATP-binding protein [Lacrimispora celerecrescens]|uniref:Histidine kinase/DNA gyrase B/HSP90-like ATPase n=1 Tax=[Clostridium] celerecrescens 18A TaxID=1286362 RepID=A0A2M8Z9J4_9FIRM|nr:ATP-binding protein [Lacrimispora celerecrescens]PJJ30114.1 histidine kinase/DNA gyrase B/HSP90-like ATPase [[Clostridium] celerecrescens 18A]